MNVKRFFLILPALLMPYVLLLAVAVIFISGPVSKWILETVFFSNALNLVAALAVYVLIALILSALCFFGAIRNNWQAVSLAKTAMIVKLIQIPGYLIIFVLSILFLLSIFTFPFVLAFLALNCMTVFMTSLPLWAACIVARKQAPELSLNPILMILPVLFCADVIGSVLTYRKLRHSTLGTQTQPTLCQGTN